MGWQKIRHDLATEQQKQIYICTLCSLVLIICSYVSLYISYFLLYYIVFRSNIHLGIVGLTILIAMLLVKNACGICLDPYYWYLWQSSTGILSPWSQCCGWTSPCVSYYDCKTNLNHNHQVPEKSRLSISWRDHGIPKCHTERLLWRGASLGLSGKKYAWQSRKGGLDPWIRNILWRKKCEASPVFLCGKSHRQRSLMGYSPWGHNRVWHDLATKQH